MRPHTLFSILLFSLAASCSLFGPDKANPDRGLLTFFSSARDRADVYKRFERLGYDLSPDGLATFVLTDSPESLVVRIMAGKGASVEELCRLTFAFEPSGELVSILREPEGQVVLAIKGVEEACE